MEATAVITTIADALRDKSIIRALLLSGGHGNGRADSYSDIDFILVSNEGVTDEVASLWRSAVEQIGEIVLWRDRAVRPALINAITADWTRTDVVMLKPEQMSSHVQTSLRPLFDHDNLYGRLPKDARLQKPNPVRLRYQFEEFIRILGLLHLAAGRKEYINGVSGIFHLRNLLVDLLIEETGATDRGGALHLNRLLSEEQKELITALPPPIAEREAMIATQLAYARAYLPRARRLAVQSGVEWPERFEAATWAKLGQSLGIGRPY